MVFSAKTDIGNVREKNEDYYDIVLNKNDAPYIFIIADGMGGHSGGEIASKVAVESVKRYIVKYIKEDSSSDEVLNILKEAFIYSNEKVIEASKISENNNGMGTTLSVAVFLNSKIHIAHVGDSRIYIAKELVLKKLTIDHSYTAALVESGTISIDEARIHPSRNIITRAIGSSQDLLVDLMRYDYNNGEICLMCTDGLSNMVSNDEIYKILTTGDDLNTISDNLIRAANTNGGNDNTTVILVK